MAAPCTLYKPGDIENARANLARHKWAQQVVSGWKQSVAYALEQDRAFLERMISELTNWPEYGQNCPVCVGKQSSMGECGIYKWDVRQPDKLTCKYCKTTYPNTDYPETGSMTCPRMGQTFTFYLTDAERAHPQDTSGKHAFRWASWPGHTSWSGVIRSRKSSWCASKVLPLAKLYVLTGEADYAERCAWILERLARVYPNWLFHTYNGTYADCPPAEAAASMGTHGRAGRFPKETVINAFGLHQAKDHAVLCVGFWGAGRFGCSGSDGSFILRCLTAYDLIRDAVDADGNPVITPEMDVRITHDLLLAGLEDTEHWKDINNKCGPGRALSAAAGILFERPESVRRALDGFVRLMDGCFHVDGFCRESPSYSGMHLGLMRDIPEILRGYSDPDGYQPATGVPIRDLDPFQDVSRYRLALESMVRMLTPNRRFPVIGDTHWRAGLSTTYVEILADRYGPRYAGLLEAVQGSALSEQGSEYALWYRKPDLAAGAKAELPLRSEWFPGWHVAVLRSADPLGHTALYLNAYAYHGHRHMDTLGLIYYAYGQELASDRGYIWDDPRNAWTKSTRSHNVVTVDGANQQTKGRASALELFGVAPGVEVVQASANAYAQCERYQRTCALVRVAEGVTYVVDIFRVRGGKLHQYGFQCNGTLADITNAELQPADESIKWLTNLRACRPTGPFVASWLHEGVTVDLHVLSPVQRLLVADAPGWRSDKGTEQNAPPIQQIYAERRLQEGTDALASTYVTILSAHQGVSPIRSVRLLEGGAETDTVAVAVELGDRTDYIISNPGGLMCERGPVKLDGRFGLASLSPAGICQTYLLDGSVLSCDGTTTTLAAPRIAARVKAVRDRTFELAEPLAVEAIGTGAYLLVGDTGYEIESVSADVITVRDYPAVPCDEIQIVNSIWLEARQQDINGRHQ